MDAELKAKWVNALRSGDYRQAKGALKYAGGFCCLGVLCDLQGANFDNIKQQFGTLSLCHSPSDFLGTVPDGIRTKVAEMNDYGASFLEIADYIETNL